MKISVLMMPMLNEVRGEDTEEAECWTPAGSAFFTYFYRLIDASNSTHAMYHQQPTKLCWIMRDGEGKENPDQPEIKQWINFTVELFNLDPDSWH